MARQRFFPRNLEAQPEWLGIYANNLQQLGPALGLDPAELAASVADALYLKYCLGVWLTAVRSFAPAATAAVKAVGGGTGPDAQALPTFTAPPLPGAVGSLPAVVPVPPGALRRIMKFIVMIKTRPAYTVAIGVQLGIVGAGEAAARAVPTFTVEVETGLKGQQVRIRFKKFGRKGVAIYSRRAGGEWELLGIDLASPFVDKRPLLVAGQPETREYRLRFFEDDASTGDYTPVASVIVGM